MVPVEVKLVGLLGVDVQVLFGLLILFLALHHLLLQHVDLAHLIRQAGSTSHHTSQHVARHMM